MIKVTGSAENIINLIEDAQSKMFNGDERPGIGECLKLLTDELNKPDYKKNSNYNLSRHQLQKSIYNEAKKLIKDKKDYLGLSFIPPYLNRLSHFVHQKDFEEYFGKFDGDIWNPKLKKIIKSEKNIDCTYSKINTRPDRTSNNSKHVQVNANQNEIIRSYLEAALARVNSVEFHYKPGKDPNREAQIEDVFIPLKFEEIFNDNKPITRMTNEKTSSEAILSNNVGVKLFSKIFNPSNEGVGFIAELGYGKTTTCQAFFCAFANHALGYPNFEIFKDEFSEQNQLCYIPVLFSCNKVDMSKHIDSIPVFVDEALLQLGIPKEDPIYSAVFTEIINLYYDRKSSLLLLIDALDEFGHKDDLNSAICRNKFLTFIKNELMISKRNPIIYTKRDVSEISLKKNTIQFSIMPLEFPQQERLIQNLLKHNGYTDVLEIEKHTKNLIEQLSGDILKTPFSLTNAVYFYLRHSYSIPEEDDLEEELIRTFFERKGEPYCDIIELFLVDLAYEMNENKIEKIDLIKFVYNFYKENPKIESLYPKDNIVQKFCHPIGLLMETEDSESKQTYYKFLQKKTWNKLIDLGKPVPNNIEDFESNIKLNGELVEDPNHPNLGKFKQSEIYGWQATRIKYNKKS